MADGAMRMVSAAKRTPSSAAVVQMSVNRVQGGLIVGTKAQQVGVLGGAVRAVVPQGKEQRAPGTKWSA